MPARRPLLASLALVSAGLPARSGVAAMATWNLVTEYPATSMPGEGVAHFAAAATRLAAGALTVRPGFDAPGGLRSADTPRAVAEGRVAAADAFTGALAGKRPSSSSPPCRS